MKKKSLVAMGLAGVMTIGMCVPVLAEDNTLDAVTSNKNVDVDFTIDQAYTVTIPTKLQVGTETAEINISAIGNLIDGNSLDVSIDNITDEGISLDYYKSNTDSSPVQNKKTNVKVSKGAGYLTTSDKVVAKFSNDTIPGKDKPLVKSADAVNLEKQPDVQAGYYKGIVTFKVDVNAAP